MVFLENEAEKISLLILSEELCKTEAGAGWFNSIIETFLSELTRFFQKSRNAGSLYITMTRYDGRTKPKPRASKLAANPPAPIAEYKCLIRAHLAKKKLSTVVSAKDVNKFQLAYANLLKGNMDGLKKKDKKKIVVSTKATQ